MIYYYYCKYCNCSIIRKQATVYSLCSKNRYKGSRLIPVNKLTHQIFWQLKKLSNQH